MNELPVHNFIFQRSCRHCPNMYSVFEPASVSTSHRSLLPALWTTSWLLAPHRRRRTFSQRDAFFGWRNKWKCFIFNHNGVRKPDVHLLRSEIVWRNAPRIWRDFGSTLPIQTCLTQTKPVLPLSNEHGSQVKNHGRRQCCHSKHKRFPYWPTRDVSLLSGHASYVIPSDQIHATDPLMVQSWSANGRGICSLYLNATVRALNVTASMDNPTQS